MVIEAPSIPSYGLQNLPGRFCTPSETKVNDVAASRFKKFFINYQDEILLGFTATALITSVLISAPIALVALQAIVFLTTLLIAYDSRATFDTRIKLESPIKLDDEQIDFSEDNFKNYDPLLQGVARVLLIDHLQNKTKNVPGFSIRPNLRKPFEELLKSLSNTSSENQTEILQILRDFPVQLPNGVETPSFLGKKEKQIVRDLLSLCFKMTQEEPDVLKEIWKTHIKSQNKKRKEVINRDQNNSHYNLFQVVALALILNFLGSEKNEVPSFIKEKFEKIKLEFLKISPQNQKKIFEIFHLFPTEHSDEIETSFRLSDQEKKILKEIRSFSFELSEQHRFLLTHIALTQFNRS